LLIQIKGTTAEFIKRLAGFLPAILRPRMNIFIKAKDGMEEHSATITKAWKNILMFKL